MKPKSDVISLADEDAVRAAVWASVLGLWDVVNTLTRLRPSRRERYRVSIFGAARVKRGSFAYEETKRAAKALAEMGCDVITGGGPGSVFFMERALPAIATMAWYKRFLED